MPMNKKRDKELGRKILYLADQIGEDYDAAMLRSRRAVIRRATITGVGYGASEDDSRTFTTTVRIEDRISSEDHRRRQAVRVRLRARYSSARKQQKVRNNSR